MNSFMWRTEASRQATWRVLEQVSNCHAPSQLVEYTRAAVLQRLIYELGAANRIRFDSNFRDTGNAVLFLGETARPPDILVLAHADELSYLLAPDGGSETALDGWPL